MIINIRPEYFFLSYQLMYFQVPASVFAEDLQINYNKNVLIYLECKKSYLFKSPINYCKFRPRMSSFSTTPTVKIGLKNQVLWEIGRKCTVFIWGGVHFWLELLGGLKNRGSRNQNFSLLQFHNKIINKSKKLSISKCQTM